MKQRIKRIKNGRYVDNKDGTEEVAVNCPGKG